MKLASAGRAVCKAFGRLRGVCVEAERKKKGGGD